MTESETDDSQSDPFEAAYRAYVQAMKDFWANVDVDAVVRERRRRGPVLTAGSAHPCLIWWESSAGAFGTYGTYGTYGCSGGGTEEEPD